jgi:hypothetical protein
MPQQQTTIIPNTTKSEVENASETQSLITRSQDLGRSVDWWNGAMLWTLGFTALAAITVVFTTRMVIFRSKQLADVQDKIIEFKDRQVSFDLGKQKGETAKAQQSAGEANERSKNLEHDNLQLRGQVANLETAAANAKKDAETLHKAALDAKAAQQQVETHLAEQRERAAKAERELLELQQTLADRQLSDKQFKEIIEALRPFSGQEYDVTAYWDSKESLNIAERINQALQIAEWKFLPMTQYRAMLGGVVGIQIWRHPEADTRTIKAAESLIAALLREGLQAEPRIQNPTNNPKHNRISLSIGAKR